MRNEHGLVGSGEHVWVVVGWKGVGGNLMMACVIVRARAGGDCPSRAADVNNSCRFSRAHSQPGLPR